MGTNESDTTTKWTDDRLGLACLGAAGLLLFALGDQPHGFYQLLRLVVTCVAAFVILNAHKGNRTGWLLFGAAAALLFNPVIPVEFEEAEWKPLDLAFGIGFTVLAFTRLVPKARQRIVAGQLGLLAGLAVFGLIGVGLYTRESATVAPPETMRDLMMEGATNEVTAVDDYGPAMTMDAHQSAGQANTQAAIGPNIEQAQPVPTAAVPPTLTVPDIDRLNNPFTAEIERQRSRAEERQRAVAEVTGRLALDADANAAPASSVEEPGLAEANILAVQE
jgi:hypothetical protein